MQISYKPVVQAWPDFIILMHTSEQLNFKFLFLQFRLVKVKSWVKHSHNNRFKKFSQVIYKVSLHGITFMYKLDQVSADSGKSHCLTRVLLKELFFLSIFKALKCFQNRHLLMHKRTLCRKRAGFPFLIKKILKLSSFHELNGPWEQKWDW